MIIPNSLRKARNEWVEHRRRKNIDFYAYYTPIYLSNSSSNAIHLAKFYSIIFKVICFICVALMLLHHGTYISTKQFLFYTCIIYLIQFPLLLIIPCDKVWVIKENNVLIL